MFHVRHSKEGTRDSKAVPAHSTKAQATNISLGRSSTGEKKPLPNERECECTQQQFCVFGRREAKFVAPEESRKHVSWPDHCTAWSFYCQVTILPGHYTVWSLYCLVTMLFGHYTAWSLYCLVTTLPGHYTAWSTGSGNCNERKKRREMQIDKLVDE